MTLTSVDVTVRMRSKSSTNCLKVGLCEGTACQHSLMIMYLCQEQLWVPGLLPIPTSPQATCPLHIKGPGRNPATPGTGERTEQGSQVMCAVGWFVHTVALFQ